MSVCTVSESTVSVCTVSESTVSVCTVIVCRREWQHVQNAHVQLTCDVMCLSHASVACQVTSVTDSVACHVTSGTCHMTSVTQHLTSIYMYMYMYMYVTGKSSEFQGLCAPKYGLQNMKVTDT